jgi:hypothetical protein
MIMGWANKAKTTSGTINELFNCLFPDGGVAFVDEAREHSSLTKLSLYDHFPFDAKHFVWSLDHINLESLMLSNIIVDDGKVVAVTATEINYLYLDD